MKPLLDYLRNDSIKKMINLRTSLRICLSNRKYEACCILYDMLGLYEEAVDLSLTVNSELAKKYANRIENEKSKKKLWIKISQFICKQNIID